MNMTEKNRSLVFLGGTMLVGILIVGILLFSESSDVESIEVVNEQASTNFPILENKIKSLKTHNFNPNSYNTIATEIDASYQQELITSTAKTNLISSLSSVYSTLVYNQCEMYLTNNFGNSDDILSWLTQLEKISSKNARTDQYRNQIKWYKYYSTSLPSKVNNFIAGGNTNFDENVYLKLKEEVQKMPSLESRYKNAAKFNTIRSQLTARLTDFYNQWNQQEIGI
ncbi:MAG: hypothetical protein K2Y30_01155 [Flavobacteriaceae bacterium]|nr:hypothetical protein [Flavobacteriaceae bacterium]